jgi:hypothetical protein
MDAAETLRVNRADAESPAGLPVTLMVNEPADAAATTKEAETAPLLTEHVSEATTPPPDSEHDESLGANPEPDTCTVAPTPAVEGFTVMVGIAELTWKLAEAESPPGLAVAVIV